MSHGAAPATTRQEAHVYLGLFTDSVEALSLELALDLAARIGVSGIEIATGGVSRLRHARAEELLADAGARRALSGAVSSRGLRIAALNCSGFPMHPILGAQQRASIEMTIRLAGELGVPKIVTMSGTPGDGEGATTVNWLWYPWPADAVALLERQWDEAIELWQELGTFALRHGVERIAFELHPLYLVYNVPTLIRMRDAIGPVIGANVDPSHMFWQQMDPVAVVRALGPAVFHVHLKDTAVVPDEVALAGVLDGRPFENLGHRAWEFRTIGRGHDRAWWTSFLEALQEIGYDDILSIENEDERQPAAEGVEEAAAFILPLLRSVELQRRDDR
jgi:sugar phosphate isomerase/epimerase